MWIQEDIALFIHEWNLRVFFFFFPNILLLTLIRCLGDVGSSGFWKQREGSKNLLHFVPCSSYSGLLTAVFPVPSLLNPVHNMKCWVFSLPLLLLLFILLLSNPAYPLPLVSSSSISLIPTTPGHWKWLQPSPISNHLGLDISYLARSLFQKYLWNLCWFFFFTKPGLPIKAIFPIKSFVFKDKSAKLKTWMPWNSVILLL